MCDVAMVPPTDHRCRSEESPDHQAGLADGASLNNPMHSPTDSTSSNSLQSASTSLDVPDHTNQITLSPVSTEHNEDNDQVEEEYFPDRRKRKQPERLGILGVPRHERTLFIANSDQLWPDEGEDEADIDFEPEKIRKKQSTDGRLEEAALQIGQSLLDPLLLSPKTLKKRSRKAPAYEVFGSRRGKPKSPSKLNNNLKQKSLPKSNRKRSKTSSIPTPSASRSKSLNGPLTNYANLNDFSSLAKVVKAADRLDCEPLPNDVWIQVFDQVLQLESSTTSYTQTLIK